MKPLSFVGRNTYLSLGVALSFLGSGLGRFLIIPTLAYIALGKNFSSQLTINTVGYWLCIVVSASLIASVLDWLMDLILLSSKDENGSWHLYVRHSDVRVSYLKLCVFTAFGIAIFAYRVTGSVQMFSGAFWLPALIIFLAIFELWMVTSSKIFCFTKQYIDDEEHHRIIMGGTAQYRQMYGENGSSRDSKSDETIVDVVAPRFNFSAVKGMDELKSRLLDAGSPVVSKARRSGAEPRNGILLSSDPGNGKTFIAEALAGELSVKFIALDHSKVVSEWVGKTPRSISLAFKQAREAGPCVLFIDEVDSFISNRDGAGSQLAENANIVNVLLTELVNIRRYPVLVVAATNRLSKLDPAAIREGRFDFKIEVPPPDETARIALLTDTLAKHVKGVTVDHEAVISAAKRWEGFSVKRLMAVAEEMPGYLKDHPSPSVAYEQLMGSLRRIQGRRGRVPADTRPLEQLVLPSETADAVRLIANRIADPLRIERLGGTLPSGILFHGPAGTGKTAVARALAKKTGWAFISVAGPDLLRDTSVLDDLYAEAKDIRPVIIFIDEADAVLRDRAFSASSAITDKFLTIMDGALGKVKDVLFVAATNNPDQIDPAMLRAGRFTEKVPFFAADANSALILIKQWISTRRVKLAAPLTVEMIGQIMDGQSPANIEGVLQYALNMAIDSQPGDDIKLGIQHIGQAMAIVVPT